MSRIRAASPELLRLVAAVCDGTATQSELTRLEALIGRNSDDLRLLLDFLQLQSDLQIRERASRAVHAVLAQVEEQASDEPLSSENIGRKAGEAVPTAPVSPAPGGFWRGGEARRHPLQFLLVVTALTSVVWGTFGAMILSWRAEPQFGGQVAPSQRSSPVVARLVATERARWNPAVPAPARDAALRQGQVLDLLDGTAEVVFRSGAVVMLQGPARLRLVSGGSGRLDHGQLATHVPVPAQGFIIDTPKVRVVDLGTRFALACDASGAVDVVVYEGLVEVQPLPTARRGALKPHHLAAGQTLRVDARGRTRPLDPARAKRLPRSRPSTSPDETLYAQYVRSLEPEAYWRLNGAWPGALADQTEAHDAVAAPGVTFDHAGAAIAGDPNNTAARFYLGEISRLAVRHAPGLKFELGESLTMAAFIKLDNLSGIQTLFGRGRTSASQGANYMLRTQEGRLSFYFRNAANSGWPLYTSDNVVLTAGDWTHVALTHTFGTTDDTKLYVDGRPVAASPTISGTGSLSDPPFDTNDELWIGERMGAGDPLGGLIDEVVLFRYVLRGEQIARLAARGQEQPDAAVKEARRPQAAGDRLSP